MESTHTTTMPDHHTCPYAAALSDDEDANSQNAVPSSSSFDVDHYDSTSSSSPLRTTNAAIVLEARLKCPAFANGAPCPFRNCNVDDPTSLMEVMKTVPQSHFHALGSNSSAGDSAVTTNAATTANYKKTNFQVALEHVHQVSSWLSTATTTTTTTTTTTATQSPRISVSEESSRFIISGGVCPFKSFHTERNNNSNISDDNSKTEHLARAMEQFSLAAIMGQMAEAASDDDDDDEDEDDVRESNFGVDEEKEAELEGGIVNDNVPKEEERHTQHNLLLLQQQQRPSYLSQALKTGTAVSHTAAEDVHFVKDFINGKIDSESYKLLVTGLYHAYVTLEDLLDEHAPTYFPTLHFPMELSRRESLQDDMEYWHGLDWEKRLGTSGGELGPSPTVRDYMNRMIEVGKHDPLLLLSHAYTRYLGDLSGGKILSRIARRALNLGTTRGDKTADGLKFYEFDHIPSAKVFKDQYRTALDELVLSSDDVRRLVAEANVAFALNMRVFEELDVKGGVPGARVRNVREALSYYDIEMERQRKISNGEAEAEEVGGMDEEAKCPFGFVGSGGSGGVHKPNNSGVAEIFGKQKIASSKSSSSVGESTTDQNGRCPWPFVFFHDPAVGMRDWQTWFIFGLVLCWFWSCVSNLYL